MKTHTLSITDNHIDQRDLDYESHSRGTNYIATVHFSPSAPGGLERGFWNKGSGSWREVPPGLAAGAVIEVAYDYTTGGGNRRRKRDFYRVLEISEQELLLGETDKPGPEESGYSEVSLAHDLLNAFIEHVAVSEGFSAERTRQIAEQAIAIQELMNAKSEA